MGISQLRGNQYLSDPLTGWWKPDLILESANSGDTIVFQHDDNFIPFGTEFFENGKCRTMTLWAFCGNVSRVERILGGNKSKFRKGKWTINVHDNGVFLLIEESKIKNRNIGS